MKAIRKSDGKIIEVRLFDFDSEVGKMEFIDRDNYKYPRADLDFNLPEEKEYAVIEGWVARDEYNANYHDDKASVNLFASKPERDYYDDNDLVKGFWYDASGESRCISLPVGDVSLPHMGIRAFES